MSILGATIAAIAALVMWAAASPKFAACLVAVCRVLQEPAACLLAVWVFIVGLWLLADLAQSLPVWVLA